MYVVETEELLEQLLKTVEKQVFFSETVERFPCGIKFSELVFDDGNSVLLAAVFTVDNAAMLLQTANTRRGLDGYTYTEGSEGLRSEDQGNAE